MQEKKIKIKDIELFCSSEDSLVEYIAYRYIVKDDNFYQMLGSQPFLFYFLEPECSFSEDKVIFKYTIPEGYHKIDDIKPLSKLDKLRFCINVASFSELFKTRMVPVLHPQNIVFDDNLVPKMMYCGIKNILEPYALDADDFLLCYKCFIISVFDNMEMFEKLYEGNLFSVKPNSFVNKVKQQETVEDLVAFLKEEFRKEEASIQNDNILVRKKSFKIFKILATVMTVLSVVLGSLSVYLGISSLPFKDRMADSAEAFIKEDYMEVIRILGEDSVSSLPTLNKYILAHSYIDSENLSDEQKTNIMNILSLKSPSEYLEFWIYLGRGELDKSLDIGKSLGDNQLILLALAKQLEYVQSSNDLSGEEKEAQIDALTKQIETYKERLAPSEKASDAASSNVVSEEVPSAPESAVDPEEDTTGAEEGNLPNVTAESAAE